MIRGAGDRPQSPDPKESLAAVVFERLISNIGTTAINDLFKMAEEAQEDGLKGAVAFPEDEFQHAIAVRDDGLVYFRFGDHEQYTIPLPEATQIAEVVTKREEAVKASRARLNSTT